MKKRIAASLWYRSVDGAIRTIAGYEAMNMIRKGQVRWLGKGDIVGQVRFIEQSSGSLRSCNYSGSRDTLPNDAYLRHLPFCRPPVCVVLPRETAARVSSVSGCRRRNLAR